MKIQTRKVMIATVVFILFGMQGIKAQTTVDTARNVALEFFKTYDSIPYLTFDVRYTLISDTLYSDFIYEVMNGSYTMSGRKAKYSLGDVDYLQNDSFLIAVYHKDQMMVVSNPSVQNTGSYLPMREALDSLLQAYSGSYDISVKSIINDPETDTVGYIKLIKKAGDTLGQYNLYIIEFDMPRNTIRKVEFEYTEPGLGLTPAEEPDDGQRLLKNTARRKTLRIEFFNYRFDNFSDDVYSENNLVWEEDGEYRPVEKYKNYKIYNTRN